MPSRYMNEGVSMAFICFSVVVLSLYRFFFQESLSAKIRIFPCGKGKIHNIKTPEADLRRSVIFGIILKKVLLFHDSAFEFTIFSADAVEVDAGVEAAAIYDKLGGLVAIHGLADDLFAKNIEHAD